MRDEERARLVVSSAAEGALSVKDRMAIEPFDMPSQEPGERIKNMDEVALGYSEIIARAEAERCLNCKNKPCIQGCPVKIDIPLFIEKIREGDYQGSLRVINRDSLLPSICGRVCPQENQCQKYCTLGKALKSVDKAVQIGRLERFVADINSSNMILPEIKEPSGKKVAIVGSGPAAISCAADLRKEGHEVVIFEALHKTGGVLSYGIPEFRLPKRLVEREFAKLDMMGVKIEKNVLVGRTISIKQLMEDEHFDAVFVASGAGLPRFMGIKGENSVGVFSANEYLTRSNLMKAYDKEKSHTPIFSARRVAVLGGGNVAMDAARTALRLGAESVDIVYRRTRAEMPARREEVGHAVEEGCNILELSQPVEIKSDENGKVSSLVIRKCRLGEVDQSGRRSPVEIEGSDYERSYDAVIVAIGNASNPLIKMTTDEIEVNRKGNFIVNEETNETSMRNVYAGGDIVLGAATVILAMGQGRKAASAINERLCSEG